MKRIITTDPALTIEDIRDVLKEPVVIRVTNFDSGGVEDFEEDMGRAHESGQPIIPIIIDSYGGSAYACSAMISAIEHSRIPVATIVTSKAMSAGAILFAFGTEGYRFMCPHATLMLHDIASAIDGKIEDMKADVKHVDYLNSKVYKRMAKHLGHEENYFLDLLQKHKHLDIHLTARQAKRHRIANILKVPTLDVSIKVDFKLSV